MVAYMRNTGRKAVFVKIIDALAAVKSVTEMPYRHLQGMLIETLGDEDSPRYTIIYGRFQALEVKRNGGVLAVMGSGSVLFRPTKLMKCPVH